MGGNGNEQTTVTASCDYKKVDTVTINGVEYDIVVFGLWPQTIKADSVTVDKNTCQKETHGAFTYCKGSDGQWYVEQAEKAYGDYTYSDGTTVGKDETTTKWFKVEPIKWRVLTNSYGGNKLLLAESILIAKRYDDDKNNYKASEIRAWLIGDFFLSAFTAAQQAAIPTTTVDNSAHSTNPDANATQWNSGANQYASDTPTSDKIFLLSEQEVTTSAYGFADYDKYVGDSSGTTSSTRIRATTDFAKATGVNQNSNAGLGGWWWLRSPCFNNAYYVYFSGKPDDPNGVIDRGGVVPALSIAN